MRISRAHWDELVAHAREEAPNECCGYLWVRDDRVSGVERAENEIDSRYGYRLDANSMLAAWKKEEEEGLQVGTYHSHPRGPAEPSQQDINIAEWPDWLYVIVGLSGDPEVRAWWIRDRKVEEEELHVDD